MLAVCRSSLLNFTSLATRFPDASGTPFTLTLRPGSKLVHDICSFRRPRPFGACTFVSSVSVTVWVAPSEVRTVMVSAARPVIIPLTVLVLSPHATEARVRVKAKVHKVILFIAVSLLEIFGPRYAGG